MYDKIFGFGLSDDWKKNYKTAQKLAYKKKGKEFSSTVSTHWYIKTIDELLNDIYKIPKNK